MKTIKCPPKCPPKCPMCRKPASREHKPFCSKRCADLDLGRWLNEDYRIASDEEFGPDEEEPS